MEVRGGVAQSYTLCASKTFSFAERGGGADHLIRSYLHIACDFVHLILTVVSSPIHTFFFCRTRDRNYRANSLRDFCLASFDMSAAFGTVLHNLYSMLFLRK